MTQLGKKYLKLTSQAKGPSPSYKKRADRYQMKIKH